MRLNAVKVLEISITNRPKNEILEEIQKYLQKSNKKIEKPLIIVTPNTEQLVYAKTDSHFADILNRADIAIPDSVGVVWASRVLTQTGILKQIPGVEFMESLVLLAEKNRSPIVLIGGRDNLAVKTLDCLRQKHHGIIGWAESAPEMSLKNFPGKDYFMDLAKKIADSRAKIVFVALGPPKQEYFVEALANVLTGPVVLMVVGGAFDMISGRLSRAPLFFRRTGFEWLWRLIQEPWRIKRQLALVKFVVLVVREKIRGVS